MRTYLLNLAIWATLSFSATANGAELSSAYRSSTLDFLGKLQSNDVKRIGCDFNYPESTCIRVQKLIELAESVEFVELENFDKSLGATRWSAFNDPKEKVIYLNRQKNDDTSLYGANGFHELVQIASFQRSNGQKTIDTEFELTALATHIIESSEEFSDFERKMKLKEIEYPLRMKDTLETDELRRANSELNTGGGTLIGGGGDLRTLKIRLEVERKFREFLGPQYSFSYRGVWPFIRIEFVESQLQKISYTIDFNERHVTQILVPHSMNLEEAIYDISWLLESLNVDFRYDTSSSVLIGEGPMSSLPLPNDFSKIHPIALEGYWLPYVKSICPDLSCVNGRGL